MNKEEFKKRQNITEEQYQRYLNLPEQRLKRWLIFRLERWMKKVWGYNTFWKWYQRTVIVLAILCFIFAYILPVIFKTETINLTLGELLIQ